MKIKELRKKNIADLKGYLEEKRKALADIRFGTSGSKAKNVKSNKNLRKDIAQTMTLMNEAKKTK